MEETTIINRALYINKILPFVNKNLVKVLVGQRRSGKSYILKSIIKEIKTQENVNIIEINLEDFAFSHVKDSQTLYDEIKSKIDSSKKNYIFIDEIQEVEGFEKVIRSLALDHQNDIYITGSNSMMLSSEISTRLAGRSVEFKIYPLSYAEYLIFHNREDSDTSLMEYLRFGGMPYLRNLSDISAWNEYLTALADTIVYRDIVSRYHLRNLVFLQRLILFLSDNIGQLFSAKKIADFLKSQRINGSVAGVQSYIQYLLDAFIISRVRRWDIEGKRFFEIGEKFYFTDTGIRNCLIGFRPHDLSGLIENTVYNHLMIYGYEVKIGTFSQGKEIDFIAEKNGEKIYIQVAQSVLDENTRNREYGNLLEVPDTYEKMVVTLDESYPNSYEGVKTLSLREFLGKLKRSAESLPS